MRSTRTARSHWANLYALYTRHRFGENRPAPVMRSIMTKDQRGSVVAKLVSVMRNWTSSPFEFEGTMVHNLRAGFCLRGMRWGQADFEARALVHAALNAIGARRPTWEEGQREHTLAVENCGRCGRALDDGQIARRARHCSVECAKATLAVRQTDYERQHTAIGRSAVYFVYRHEQPTRPCKSCGAHFHPSAPGSAQTFCSVTCAKREHRRGEERDCQVCGTPFYVKADKVRDGNGKFCSRACYIKSKSLARYDRVCNWCGTDFIAAGAKARFCSRVCRLTSHNHANGHEPRELRPHIFDHFVTMPVNASRPVWLTPDRFDEMMMG